MKDQGFIWFPLWAKQLVETGQMPTVSSVSLVVLSLQVMHVLSDLAMIFKVGTVLQQND